MSTQLLDYPKDNLKEFCQANDLTYLGLFGSVVRGDETETSDVDVLIDFKKDISFFELARMQFALEALFGRSVDLVPRPNLKAALRPYIEQDLLTIYEER